MDEWYVKFSMSTNESTDEVIVVRVGLHTATIDSDIRRRDHGHDVDEHWVIDIIRSQKIKMLRFAGPK